MALITAEHLLALDCNLLLIFQENCLENSKYVKIDFRYIDFNTQAGMDAICALAHWSKKKTEYTEYQLRHFYRLLLLILHHISRSKFIYTYFLKMHHESR